MTDLADRQLPPNPADAGEPAALRPRLPDWLKVAYAGWPALHRTQAVDAR